MHTLDAHLGFEHKPVGLQSPKAHILFTSVLPPAWLSLDLTFINAVCSFLSLLLRERGKELLILITLKNQSNSYWAILLERFRNGLSLKTKNRWNSLTNSKSLIVLQLSTPLCILKLTKILGSGDGSGVKSCRMTAYNVCDSSFRRSIALFWSTKATVTHEVHIYASLQNTHAYKHQARVLPLNHQCKATHAHKNKNEYIFKKKLKDSEWSDPF